MHNNSSGCLSNSGLRSYLHWPPCCCVCALIRGVRWGQKWPDSTYSNKMSETHRLYKQNLGLPRRESCRLADSSLRLCSATFKSCLIPQKCWWSEGYKNLKGDKLDGKALAWQSWGPELVPSTHWKLGVIMCSCNPSPGEVAPRVSLAAQHSLICDSPGPSKRTCDKNWWR